MAEFGERGGDCLICDVPMMGGANVGIESLADGRVTCDQCRINSGLCVSCFRFRELGSCFCEACKAGVIQAFGG